MGKSTRLAHAVWLLLLLNRAILPTATELIQSIRLTSTPQPPPPPPSPASARKHIVMAIKNVDLLLHYPAI